MTRPYFIGWVVVVVLLLGGIWQTHNNQIEACERGNPVRSVVYKNTLAATHDRGSSAVSRREFRENLDEIRAVDHTDPRTGKLNCGAAIRWFPWE